MLIKVNTEGLLVVPLHASVLEQAAQLRAASPSLSLPDAIHLTTAALEQCNVFLTNDRRLRAVGETQVVVISD